MQASPEILDEMLRHLPPSAHQLQLLDLNTPPSPIAARVRFRRPDVRVLHLPAESRDTYESTALPFAASSIDAVLIYDMVAQSEDNISFFKHMLLLLRPGGRFIAFASGEQDAEQQARQLSSVGFVRVLGENLRDGVLFRGEKPYAESFSTLERVAVGASPDQTLASNQLLQGADLKAVKGRYIHLLIRETPNIPVWRRQRETPLNWETVCLTFPDKITFVPAFSSLPSTVSFMQQAVLKSMIHDINKIAKFNKIIASTWDFAVIINPSFDTLLADGVTMYSMITIDPDSAETPDE